MVELHKFTTGLFVASQTQRPQGLELPGAVRREFGTCHSAARCASARPHQAAHHKCRRRTPTSGEVRRFGAVNEAELVKHVQSLAYALHLFLRGWVCVLDVKHPLRELIQHKPGCRDAWHLVRGGTCACRAKGAARYAPSTACPAPSRG
jgi:hypothetical protein